MYALQYLQKLCKFPHRGSATPEEAKAAEMIRKEFIDLGYQVEQQHFFSPRDCMYLLPLQSLVPLIILGFVGIKVNPALVWVQYALAVLVFFAITPLLLEVFGSDTEINIFPKYPSSNVMAYLEKDFHNKHTIIVSGHYDTQKGSYLFAPWFIRYTKTFFHMVYAAIALQFVSLLFLPLIPWMKIVLTVTVAFSGLAAVFLLFCELTGRYTEGANDNGTGAALTMALARHYVENYDNYPADVNFIFLLTGCEEVGSKGMKHFLKLYGDKLDPAKADFLVLDNIGAGKLTYLLGEGMLKAIPYDPELLTLAGNMKNHYEEGTILTQPNLLLPTDSLPLVSKGFRSISFLGKDQRGQLGNYHWHTDTLENVDLKLLQFAEKFFLHYLDELCNIRKRKKNIL